MSIGQLPSMNTSTFRLFKTTVDDNNKTWYQLNAEHEYFNIQTLQNYSG